MLGTATLDFAAKQGSAEITIDANSLDTEDAERDEYLRDADFFAVAQYPTITFKSDKLTFNDDKLGKGRWTIDPAWRHQAGHAALHSVQVWFSSDL